MVEEYDLGHKKLIKNTWLTHDEILDVDAVVCRLTGHLSDVDDFIETGSHILGEVGGKPSRERRLEQSTESW